jgi:hypothetical protein
MRRALIAALVAAGSLLPCGTLRAGLYDPTAGDIWPIFTDARQVWTFLGDLRGIAVEPPPGQTNEFRERNLQQVARLQAKEQTAGLTAEERVSLSTYLVRLQRPEEALRVLTAAEADAPDHFLVLAQLATLHLLLYPNDPEQLNRGINYEEKALAAWPRLWPGWSGFQRQWYRRVERYQLALMKLRQQEAARQPSKPYETVDAIFPVVHFTGPGDDYHAGELAPELQDQLPPDAVGIVSQLLIWMPFDNRLYWLFGELCNARGLAGDVDVAARVLEECVNARRMSMAELRHHRQVLLPLRRTAAILSSADGDLGKEQLLWMVAPRGATLAPGAMPALSESGWIWAYSHASRAADPGLGMFSNPPPLTAGKSDTPPQGGILANLGTFGLGLVFGVIIALLLGQQFRQRSSRTPVAPAGR